jgi:hypothetical protein
MQTLLLDERPVESTASQRGTAVCDPQVSVTDVFRDIFKDIKSKHAVLQLVKLSLIMIITPFLLTYVAAYFDWSGEQWASASLVGVNMVIAAFVLIAWKEDKEEMLEEDKKNQ